MSGQNAPTEPNGQEPNAGTGESQEPVETEPQAPASDGGDDLYEGIAEDHPVRKVITQLRKENAERRTKVNTFEERVTELESQLENATELPEVKSLVERFAGENKALKIQALQKDAAGEHKLPASLATRLQGETEEEIYADAKALAETLPEPGAPTTPTAPPRGGRTPSAPAVTPEALLEQMKSQRSR